MDKIELTVNQLYDFKLCPLKYKFSEIDHKVNAISESKGLEQAIWSTLSYFYFNLQDGRFISISELKEKFANIWYGKTDLYNIKMNGDRSKREKELTAIDMLYKFWQKQKYHPDKVVAVNMDFRIPFGDDFAIKGMIPLIRETPRGLEIVNFKTGTHKYDEFWQRTDMNITLQALAYHSIFKKEVDSICVENLRNQNSYFPTRKRKDYQRLYKTIKMIKKTMEEGWFYPREGYHCNQCPAKSLCMEWS